MDIGKYREGCLVFFETPLGWHHDGRGEASYRCRSQVGGLSTGKQDRVQVCGWICFGVDRALTTTIYTTMVLGESACLEQAETLSGILEL